MISNDEYLIKHGLVDLPEDIKPAVVNELQKKDGDSKVDRAIFDFSYWFAFIFGVILVSLTEENEVYPFEAFLVGCVIAFLIFKVNRNKLSFNQTALAQEEESIKRRR